MKDVELPPGSGRTASYDDREQRLVRELIRRGATSHEVIHLHDLKVEFGVNLGEMEEGG